MTLIQCEKCESWQTYNDRLTGKIHYSCKKTGHRSLNKWKKGNCSGFKLKANQETLEGLLNA